MAAMAMTDKIRDDLERLIYRVQQHYKTTREEALRFIVRAAMGEVDTIEMKEVLHVQ
jgi:hypothetical protein